MDLHGIADETVYVERLARAVCAARPSSLDDIVEVQMRRHRHDDTERDGEIQSLVAEYCSSSSSTTSESPTNDNDNDDDSSACLSYELTASRLQLFANVKAGVPRGAYRGLVMFRVGRTQIFLKPRADTFWATCPRAYTNTSILKHNSDELR